MPRPAIEVQDLVVRYGGTVAVDGISFDGHAGQVVALLGPNGAGKTSTVETLEGYRSPSAGTVRVLGMDPQRDHRALTRRIGVMLQRGGVYASMSPREAVRLFARYYDESEEPEGLLFRVGLTAVAATPWRRLSGGEQQRLSLALALVGRPWVAFLDEPTAGVDPQGRLTVRQVIRDLRSAGASVVLTTHEMQEAERLADRIIILDHGRVVADGSPSELMAGGGGRVIRFGAPPEVDVAALAEALRAAVVEERPGEYVVHSEAKPAMIAALTAWLAERDLALSDLRAGRERLEDVFLRLTSGFPAGAGTAGPPAAAAEPASPSATAGPSVEKAGQAADPTSACATAALSASPPLEAPSPKGPWVPSAGWPRRAGLGKALPPPGVAVAGTETAGAAATVASGIAAPEVAAAVAAVAPPAAAVAAVAPPAAAVAAVAAPAAAVAAPAAAVAAVAPPAAAAAAVAPPAAAVAAPAAVAPPAATSASAASLGASLESSAVVGTSGTMRRRRRVRAGGRGPGATEPPPSGGSR